MRGRLYKQYRPYFVLRDDLENANTAKSPAISEKIIRLLDEAKGGLSAHGAPFTVGNFIGENGVMAYISNSVTGQGIAGRGRFIPIVNESGEMSWPPKFVKTDAETLEAKRTINDPTHRLIFLESERRELNAGGGRVYEVEILLDPIATGSAFFDRPTIERLSTNCPEPEERKASFELWAEFNPAHRYAIGADTGKGNGGDHSTSVLIDFSTMPFQQVGFYANDAIPADQSVYELRRQGDLFKTCLIAPKKNSESGRPCLTTLKMIYPADRIFRQVP
jgi:hypothetical protein